MSRSKITNIGTLSVTAFNSFPAGEYANVQRTSDEVGALQVEITGGTPPPGAFLYITGRLGAGLNDTLIDFIDINANSSVLITGIEIPHQITFLVIGGNGNANATVWLME